MTHRPVREVNVTEFSGLEALPEMRQIHVVVVVAVEPQQSKSQFSSAREARVIQFQQDFSEKLLSKIIKRLRAKRTCLNNFKLQSDKPNCITSQPENRYSSTAR